MRITKGNQVALIVALVTYLLSRDLRTTLIIGGTAFGADMLL